MKNVRIFFVITVALLFLFSGEAFAQRETIMEYFDRMGTIKTYVADIVNNSGDNKINVDELEKNIENALAARLSHTFQIVRDKRDADIIVNGEIVEYVFTEKDPIDMVTGMASAAYDLLTTEHYARMQIVMSITDAKSGKVLWEDRFKSTITNPTMTEEESYGRINSRIPKIFQIRLFKKKRNR